MVENLSKYREVYYLLLASIIVLVLMNVTMVNAFTDKDHLAIGLYQAETREAAEELPYLARLLDDRITGTTVAGRFFELVFRGKQTPEIVEASIGDALRNARALHSARSGLENVSVITPPKAEKVDPFDKSVFVVLNFAVVFFTIAIGMITAALGVGRRVRIGANTHDDYQP